MPRVTERLFPTPSIFSRYICLGRMFSLGLCIFILLVFATRTSGASPDDLDGARQGILGVNASFDFVVVGAGASGLTLAARLAEQRFSVALVEAGDFYELRYPLAQVPGAAIVGIGSSVNSTTPIDWGFVAYGVPGANYRDVHYPRGRCLGGSPNKEAMQKWAELVEDDSYTFRRVLPFFQRTANFTPPNNKIRESNASVTFDTSAFDKSGEPLHVSYPDNPVTFSSWVQRGMESIGIEAAQDFNSGSLLGAQYCTLTINPYKKARSSSEAAFKSTPIPRLATLALYKNTMAKRILFSPERRAVGVVVRTRDSEYILRATREIIVSAGAFQSPQLLMVSGIGPVNALKEHGIDVIVDRPGVGQNMWDHVFFGPSYRVGLQTSTRIANDLLYLAQVIVQYIAYHHGPLTNQGTDFLAFEKLPSGVRSQFSDETVEDLSWFPSGWPEVEYAAIIGALVAPTSRGNVTIISADTDDLPIINPNWLATKTDQEVAIAVYRRIREAFKSEGMAPIIIGEEYFPGEQVQTDEEILDVVRNTVMTVYHASCTCKMGVRNDTMAVVDSQARVFGVEGLRVVDASAFPFLPPGHPQSVAYMLAEKIASDIILWD
ncbi:GMC oxidoreductase [Aspergillus carbonarius ITEM 5010]|uniref:GMC oxidoreductase n=1 Tax=Aspergillus carbonarius (strain ITEM 5010) TaxID=602072 RepID=A0A1R3RAN9_ASPC5|nr:GMC oxidoreductase [Aspergillus carbonarius ITEM 5010]